MLRGASQGAYQYEYAAAPAVDPAAPRGDDTSLENAFGNVSLNDPYYQYNQSYNQGGYGYTATHGDAEGAGVATTSGGQAQHYGMSPPQGHSSSSRKGKGLDTSAAKSKKSSRAPNNNQEREKKSSSSKRQQGSSRQKSGPEDHRQDPFYPRPPHPHSSQNAPSAQYSETETANLEGATFDGEDPYEGAEYDASSSDPTCTSG